MSAMGRVLLAIFAVMTMLLVLPGTTKAAEVQKQQNVLILNSYHKGFNWSDDQSAGMVQTIRSLGLDPIIHVEYIDWKFNPTQENLELRYEQYKLRYANQKIDLVMTTDDAALTFALKHRRELFSNAPIVFSGIMKGSPSLANSGNANITGVYERFDAEGTIRLMCRLNPNLQRIYYIYDNTESGLQTIGPTEESANKINPALKFIHLNTFTFSDIMKMLSALPADDNSAVLINTYSRDVEGTTMELERFVKLFSGSSNVPVYILYDFDSGYGAVGGSLITGWRQGEAAAKLAARVLNGESASVIPIEEATESIDILDYRQLERYRLPVDKIPPQAVLLNYPQSFYEQYKTVVWTTSGVFLLMMVFIIVLVVNTRRRRIAEEALRKSEAQYRTIFANSGTALMFIEEDATILMVNKEFEKLSGYSEAEVAGKKRWMEFVANNDELEQMQEYHRLRRLDPQAAPQTYQFQFINRQANVRDVVVTVALLPGTKQSLAALLDITERKRAEEALRHARDELETKVEERTRELSGVNQELLAMNEELQAINQELQNEIFERQRVEQELAKTNKELTEAIKNLKDMQAYLVQSEKMVALGNLVAGMAHEINTPVGIGITAASYLDQATEKLVNLCKEGVPPSKELNNYLQNLQGSAAIILKNLERAAKLINSFKRVSVDQSSEVRRIFNIKRYLDEILLSMHPRLKKTKLSVVVECDENLDIEGFPGAFSQIVTNMIMNSLTHAYDPEDDGNIRIKAWKEADNLQILYSDDGKGIETDVLNKVFEPFFTTKRGIGGTGLGLYIVYNIVTQQFGGTIECDSEPGKGATFRLCLPMNKGSLYNIDQSQE